jgi:hypothetical protein
MYSLNTTAARQADERSGRIAEIGKYLGMFTRAEDVTSSKLTRGIDFAFETQDKQSANFTLWTYNKEGKELYGFKQLQALMACMRVRDMAPKKAIVRKWDRTSEGMVDVEGMVFDALMGKPIGILFETEEYQKFENNVPTTVGMRVVPAYFFDAQSEMTASEILDKKVQPVQLAKLVQTLRHRPLRKAAGGAPAAGGGGAPAGGNGFDDDDIPFAAAFARQAWSAI